MPDNMVELLQDYDEIVDGIYTNLGVSISDNDNEKWTVRGLWDTGSTRSCISERVIEKIKMKPDGKSIIFTANGKANVNTYCVDVEFPNGYKIQNVIVSAVRIEDDTDMLIGMDIISRGSMSINNDFGRTDFRYRLRKEVS